MKNKTLLWQILSLSVVFLGAYGAGVGEQGQKWVGIISFAITAFMNSKIMSTGEWPKGWSTAMWITQLAGLVIQVINFLGEKAIIDPQVVNISIMVLNTFLATFVKDYGSGSVAVDTAQQRKK
jgi:hypothetical protein